MCVYIYIYISFIIIVIIMIISTNVQGWRAADFRRGVAHLDS